MEVKGKMVNYGSEFVVSDEQSEHSSERCNLDGDDTDLSGRRDSGHRSRKQHIMID